MMQHELARTATARQIREIPVTTSCLLTEPDLVVAAANRIRHADPRVVVISGRAVPTYCVAHLRSCFERMERRRTLHS